MMVVLVQLTLPSLPVAIAPIAQAQVTITVTTETDVVDANGGTCVGLANAALPGPDGLVSLREAICAANTEVTADFIEFDAALDGTPIVLTGVGDNNNVTGDFDIRDSLTITGNGIGNTIIDGGSSDRVFHVPTNGTVVILEMLTIQNGSSTVDGGGLFFSGNGTVTINDSLITNNQAPIAGEDGGGVANGNIGTININTSTISGNTAADSGGGVFSSGNGTINIVDSTISGNTANDEGGGVYSDSTTNITNSTISGNSAANNGGGLALSFDPSGNVTMNHVTISNNTATAGTGGGMFRLAGIGGGTVTVQNSIIAENTGTNPDCSGTFVSGEPTNRNLVQDDTGCTGFGGIDITGQNPQLGGLADNGGTTETHALLAGSPAIDATANGVGNCERPDQIGQALFDVPGVGSDCDLGAFEFQNVPNVSIADSSANESAGTMTFTVSLDATIPTTVTVQYDTSDGSATAPADYTAQVAQTVDIPPNTASATFAVPIVADAVSEGPETFTVTLSNPVWANIGTGTATGTINDTVPTLTISPSSSASITEGNSGTQPLVFNLQLSAPVPSSQTATVDFSAGGGTATGGTDFSPTSGTVTFTAGQDSQTITINITGDTSD
ncbi:MAG: Calx-beta domain-containing protein, partial [Anaerolineae bacterium]|nr:Calx-beta domain-containing protein [Anaerolineae bacterium]